MFEITCLDSNGNSIDKFTQWDMFQKINLVLHGYDYDYLYFRVHFSNKNMNESLVVEPTVTTSGSDITITADVPNEMLMEPYPVFVYLCVYYSQEDEDETEVSRRVILQAEIPVRKKPKPSDYIYVKNTDVTTFEEIVIGIVRQLKLISTSDSNGNVTTVIGGV